MLVDFSHLAHKTFRKPNRVSLTKPRVWRATRPISNNIRTLKPRFEYYLQAYNVVTRTFSILCIQYDIVTSAFAHRRGCKYYRKRSPPSTLLHERATHVVPYAEKAHGARRHVLPVRMCSQNTIKIILHALVKHVILLYAHCINPDVRDGYII